MSEPQTDPQPITHKLIDQIRARHRRTLLGINTSSTCALAHTDRGVLLSRLQQVEQALIHVSEFIPQARGEFETCAECERIKTMLKQELLSRVDSQ